MHLGSQSPQIITLLTPPDPDVTAESCWKLPLCNERGYTDTVNQITEAYRLYLGTRIGP